MQITILIGASDQSRAGAITPMPDGAIGDPAGPSFSDIVAGLKFKPWAPAAGVQSTSASDVDSVTAQVGSEVVDVATETADSDTTEDDGNPDPDNLEREPESLSASEQSHLLAGISIAHVTDVRVIAPPHGSRPEGDMTLAFVKGIVSVKPDDGQTDRATRSRVDITQGQPHPVERTPTVGSVPVAPAAEAARVITGPQGRRTEDVMPSGASASPVVSASATGREDEAVITPIRETVGQPLLTGKVLPDLATKAEHLVLPHVVVRAGVPTPPVAAAQAGNRVNERAWTAQPRATVTAVAQTAPLVQVAPKPSHPTFAPAEAEDTIAPLTVDATSAARLPVGEGLLPVSAQSGHMGRPHTPLLAQHIAQQLAVTLHDPVKGITELALDPVELGRVRMTVTAQDQAVALMIVADRPETADLMRRHVEVLQQEFRNLGYTSVNLQFGTGQGGSGAAPQHAVAGRQDDGTAGTATDEAEQMSASPLAPESGRTSDGSLDLRL